MPRITRTDSGATVVASERNGHEPVQLDEYLAALDSTPEPTPDPDESDYDGPTADDIAQADDNYWERKAAQHGAAVKALGAKLDTRLPASLIEKKTYEDGREYDYVAWYVVAARLNELFGHDGWSTTLKSIETFGGKDGGVPNFVAATMLLTVRWPNGETSTFANTGVGIPANATWGAFETAYKGAVHDALSRCAKALGDAFGLFLYAEGKAQQKQQREQRQQQRQAPKPKPSYPVATDEDEDEEQETAECQSCGKVIKGYTSKTGKTYTTADLVTMSKKYANGRVLCWDCRQKDK